jgi:hypothetical protein
VWYVGFHGGPNAVNNLLVYSDDGEQRTGALLKVDSSTPPLLELRGFALAGDSLYVVNGYKDYSQVLVFAPDGEGDYDYQYAFASKENTSSLLHPYDLAFDRQDRCYVSNQDTNVVAGFEGPNDPLPVAPGLPTPPPGTQYLAGTIVASSVGALPGVPKPSPPDVSTPQGLEVGFDDGKVANSVRGILLDGVYLYVADEVANAVKVYDADTGDLQAQIAGDNLSAPVQLLLEDTTLYIGSSGNDSVVSYDLEHGFPTPVVAPATFISGAVRHVSGIAFDSDGHFYGAERKAKTIEVFGQRRPGREALHHRSPGRPRVHPLRRRRHLRVTSGNSFRGRRASPMRAESIGMHTSWPRSTKATWATRPRSRIDSIPSRS